MNKGTLPGTFSVYAIWYMTIPVLETILTRPHLSQQGKVIIWYIPKIVQMHKYIFAQCNAFLPLYFFLLPLIFLTSIKNSLTESCCVASKDDAGSNSLCPPQLFLDGLAFLRISLILSLAL